MKLLTLDFEFIPDVELAEYLTGYKGPEAPDLAEIVEDKVARIDAMKKYALEKFDGDEKKMLPPGLHRIVTAGIHLAEIRVTDGVGEWYDSEYVSSTSDPEPVIVRNVVDWARKLLPRVVSFNGRSCDFPLLAMRAMHYGIDMGFWFSTSDKWNNYTSRYCPDYHFDVMDWLSQYGATNRMKLREVMALLRLPDKIYGGGGEVLTMWLAGAIEHIREYCEIDAFNTFLAYVYVQHLRGAITQAGKEASLRSAIAFLKKHQDQAYLRGYLLEWCRLDPFVNGECPELQPIPVTAPCIGCKLEGEGPVRKVVEINPECPVHRHYVKK